MVIGNIPWDKIVLFCEYHGVDRQATGIVIAVVRRLDNVYLKMEKNKQKKKK